MPDRCKFRIINNQMMVFLTKTNQSSRLMACNMVPSAEARAEAERIPDQPANLPKSLTRHSLQ
jgi:hypothetical protein